MSKTVHITVPVTVELRERIVAAARGDRRSMSAWIRILIEDRLNGLGSGLVVLDPTHPARWREQMGQK